LAAVIEGLSLLKIEDAAILLKLGKGIGHAVRNFAGSASLPPFVDNHIFWIRSYFEGRFPEASFAKKGLQGSHIHVVL